MLATWVSWPLSCFHPQTDNSLTLEMLLLTRKNKGDLRNINKTLKKELILLNFQ